MLFIQNGFHKTTVRRSPIRPKFTAGWGFTKDYDEESDYRDARGFTTYEGTSGIQRAVISNRIRKDKRRC